MAIVRLYPPAIPTTLPILALSEKFYSGYYASASRDVEGFLRPPSRPATTNPPGCLRASRFPPILPLSPIVSSSHGSRSFLPLSSSLLLLFLFLFFTIFSFSLYAALLLRPGRPSRPLRREKSGANIISLLFRSLVFLRVREDIMYLARGLLFAILVVSRGK